MGIKPLLLSHNKHGIEKTCYFCPMNKKAKLPFFERVSVTDAGAKGKGIAKAPDGRIIFLPYAVPGDVADVQITKKRKAYFEGKITAFHRYSDKRQEPLCQHFGICGGCKWQQMTYEHQLFYKQQEVAHNLKHIGKIALPEIRPVLGAAKPYEYRNKMDFSFSDNRWITEAERNSNKTITDRNALGFHIPRMWDKVLDIKTCHLQEAPSNAIRLAVRDFAVKHNMSFFNLRKQTGLLRSLMIRISSIGELMVVIQFYEDEKVKRELLLQHLRETFPDITSLQYVINQKANDTLYDQEVICFSGRSYILEHMEGLSFKISAKSFYQTNSHQAYVLYKIVRDFAGLTGHEQVYDLYTGTGTIALFLAKRAKKVIGLEAVPEAIADAKANAVRNKITNVAFFVGDVRHTLNENFMRENGKPDVIVTDPPREGMHKNVVRQLIAAAPEKIVYVSCNSATQARDLTLLDEKYMVTHVQPVDMFPQTHHVENVVLLKKRAEFNEN